MITRNGIRVSVPVPTHCVECNDKLVRGQGLEGEDTLYCQNDHCEVGMVWVDDEAALLLR